MTWEEIGSMWEGVWDDDEPEDIVMISCQIPDQDA